MDVVVQPSVPWMSLNDQIKDSGLFFPVDPGPSVSGLTIIPTTASGLPNMVARTDNIGRGRRGLEAWWAQAAGNVFSTSSRFCANY